MEYILQIRNKLKEEARRKMKHENDLLFSDFNFAPNKIETKLPDNYEYGTFFGPSEPCLAPSLILESKMLLPASTPANNPPPPPPKLSAKEKKKLKIQKLKESRDYSFLASQDSETPAAAKEPSQDSETPAAVKEPKVAPPASADDKDSQVGQPESEQGVGKPKRPISNTHDDGRKSPIRLQMKTVQSWKKLGGNDKSSPVKELVLKRPATKMATDHGRKQQLGNGINGNNATRSMEKMEAKRTLMEKKQRMEPKRPSAEKPNLVQRASATTDDSRPRQTKDPKQQVNRPKKRPAADEDAVARAMIREMFNYDPTKYREDEDDQNMEASFKEIQKEEDESRKQAKEEDARELQLIQEEERKEKLLRKKRLKQAKADSALIS